MTGLWGILAAVVCCSLVGSIAAEAQAATKIPLVTDLITVSAVEGPRGDYESIKRIERIDAQGVHIVYTTERHKKPVLRTVRREDQASARHYLLRFAANYPEVVPNSTGIGTSRLVYTELKTKGQSDFSCCFLFTVDGQQLEGTIRRVGTATVPIAVMVNNQRVMLPTIHATGRMGTQKSNFYFLDDSENPLALKWEVGRQRLQVIKISFPTKVAAARIETALAKTGRAEVYGIYFDFASATIKPESEPVLKEIADALTKNAKWKLNVEGHTDNVGGDAPNLDLSRRRAAAVKDALVSRYRISAARLATSGFGASRPKETNETLEGRARNRRVELATQ